MFVVIQSLLVIRIKMTGGAYDFGGEFWILTGDNFLSSSFLTLAASHC